MRRREGKGWGGAGERGGSGRAVGNTTKLQQATMDNGSKSKHLDIIQTLTDKACHKELH